MEPLIDGDILAYEIGFAAKVGWSSPEEEPPWWYVEEMLEMRIDNICAMVNATEKPYFYLTGSKNFRNDIASVKPYKDRPSNKPWHYRNIKQYLLGVKGAIIVEGLEADDLMAIEQMEALSEGRATIICSRDKDLRQVPGWHYSWELGKQPSFGPIFVNPLGWIEWQDGKLRGCGDKFFYTQCLTGDIVDNIPGLPGCGPHKAFKLLCECDTTRQCFEAVLEAYRGRYGDLAEERLLEQGRLLYMTRVLNEDGSPKLWEFPIG